MLESCSHASVRFAVVPVAMVAGVADATVASATDAVWAGNTLRVSSTQSLSFDALVRSNAKACSVHAIAFVAVAALEAAVCVDTLLVIDCTFVVRPGTFIDILTVEATKALVAFDARV